MTNKIFDQQFSHVHAFEQNITHIAIPEQFTFPFCYEPHPLSLLAVKQLQNYLESQKDFDHNFGLIPDQEGLVIGKMFGVLVVSDDNNNVGFLAACSGKLAGSNQHSYFVPPIFDMLDPQGYFIQEENKINAINKEIDRISMDSSLAEAKQQLIQTETELQQQLSDLRLQHKKNKQERKEIRNQEKDRLNEQEYQLLIEDLIKQSYRDQHEYDVAKTASNNKLQRDKVAYDNLLQELTELKEKRKLMSNALQQYLFDQYHFLNAHSETKSVLSIFKDHSGILPPAGAGECAAPKLLQYAYKHKLRPIAMAEFWWGASPNSEVRKHGYFYPACRGKCEPILNHMLTGLTVEANPMLQNSNQEIELEIIHEDEDILVINKPVEFLSVPGIHVQDSVQTRMEACFPEIDSPMIIHRLDMSTSGILVLAKNKVAHQFIQDQFIKHTVVKRYTALLDGCISTKEGIIDLPLRVDLEDRPRQVVCYTYGKPARTKFQVVSEENNKTRIHFFPLTGRTHQLRVHSAHSLGLNTPILGDDLYGRKADRLHLHAGFISFIHPGNHQIIEFHIPDPF